MTAPASTVIRRARLVDLDGAAEIDPVDVRLESGRVVAVGRDLAPAGAEVIEADGRWLMPGLWDSHVHLGQWAAALRRLDATAVDSPEEMLALVATRLRAAPGSPVVSWGHAAGAWRAVTTKELDAVTGGTPTVLVSGDVHQAWVNSAAQKLLDLPWRDEPVRETEWFEAYPLLERITGAVSDHDYRVVQLEAARLGVVGLVDFEFATSPHDWAVRHTGGGGLLRIRCATYAIGLDEVLAAGLRTGDVVPGTDGLVTMGPLKVIGDGSLNTHTAWCCEPYAEAEPYADDAREPHHGAANLGAGELRDLLRRATGAGLEVAVHAIGDKAAAVSLEAFEVTRARGSIEHAQLIRAEDVQRMARLGVRASVQPAHLLDDRDLSESVWPGRGDDCFPFRRMLSAGVDLRFGSDAPVASLDPWLTMAAAVHRSADARPPWGGSQALTVREVLAASTDGWSTVAVGHPADLVLLEDNPLAVPGEPEDTAAAGAHLRSMRAAATWVAGTRVV